MVIFISIPQAYANHNRLPSYVRGIYVSQSTLENTPRLRYLIGKAKAAGINTFVVDLNRFSRRYNKNIALLHANNISYVVRIVIFPGGANAWQVNNKKYWQAKSRFVKRAIDLGASMVQLDYIRYNTRQPSTRKNVARIREIIAWYHQQTAQHGVPLQIDIFGEVASKPSLRIGQDIKSFAGVIDSVSPMLYPSHYEPYRIYGRVPYKTVANSISDLKRQFKGRPPFAIIPYIEAYNYRIRHGRAALLNYIRAQMQAVDDARVSGWYVWSANNEYRNVFTVMRNRRVAELLPWLVAYE